MSRAPWQLILNTGEDELLRLPLETGALILGPEGVQLGDIEGEIEVSAESVMLRHGDATHALHQQAFKLGAFSLRAALDARPAGNTRSLPRSAAVRVQALRVGERSLRGGQLSIGTDSGNDLVIGSHYASAFHCLVFFRDGQWLVRDLQSKNGTFINEVRVREAVLPTPAQLRVADISLPVESEESDEDEDVLGLRGRSPSMVSLRAAVRRVATAPAPVLVLGESGSGKELVARALHDLSPRASKPFVAINCGALAASLIESELFGHARGAFTGAAERRQGAFTAADGGTLFLDEIGELPTELQPKLLRVLETSEVKAVGDDKMRQVDVRVVAATHRDLPKEVERGQFRRDLFHRLSVLRIDVPRLRDRGDDVLILARHFLSQLRPPGRLVELSPAAEATLASYEFPGNVRELKNAVVRGLWNSKGGMIEPAHMGLAAVSVTHAAPLSRLERDAIVDALTQCGGSRAQAARALGIARSTLYRKLEEYGINENDFGRT